VIWCFDFDEYKVITDRSVEDDTLFGLCDKQPTIDQANVDAMALAQTVEHFLLILSILYFVLTHNPPLWYYR